MELPRMGIFTPKVLGRNWAFIGVGLWFKICFRSTHVAEQPMSSMSPSILAFNFI